SVAAVGTMVCARQGLADKPPADTQEPVPKCEAKLASPPAIGSTPAPAGKEEHALAAKLVQRVDFSGFDDPKTTFEQALDYFAERCGVAFDVQERVFQQAGYQDKNVLQERIAITPLPALRGVRFETVLRKLLNRICTPPGKEANFLLRPSLI